MHDKSTKPKESALLFVKKWNRLQLMRDHYHDWTKKRNIRCEKVKTRVAVLHCSLPNSNGVRAQDSYLFSFWFGHAVLARRQVPKPRLKESESAWDRFWSSWACLFRRLCCKRYSRRIRVFLPLAWLWCEFSAFSVLSSQVDHPRFEENPSALIVLRPSGFVILPSNRSRDLLDRSPPHGQDYCRLP